MARIFTNRKSGFIQRGGVMRRESLWAALPHAKTTLAAAGTAVLSASLGASVLALRPFTIVRTRGNWMVKSDQSAASEDYVGSMGYAVVSDQAVAIGVTAVLTPATDQASDLFFVYETYNGRFDLVGTAINEDIIPMNFDSKAMRKVEDGSNVVVTLEAGLIGSGCIIYDASRLLLKLH